MDNMMLLSILIFAAGLLYSTVGHAGASAYLAVMALSDIEPAVMKPAALVLNILVAIIASAQFYRAGHFSMGIFWPFAIGSVPAAFVGGALTLPGSIYKTVVGIVLVFSAYWLFKKRRSDDADKGRVKSIPIIPAMMSGAVIGLVSGAIGVGGGIFLSPFLLFLGWAGTKQTAGVSAVFILVNSAAGLAGHMTGVRFLPDEIYAWAAAAVIGGFIGSHYGSRRFSSAMLYSLLGIVLFIAGGKMLLSSVF